ncbi:MAG: serine/threonine protein kinase [Lentisphaeraceae bacterium]|nr:serine/threonine protein kinase [Lentisphaeraceae bacterium]
MKPEHNNRPIDFAGYFDLAKAVGAEDPENLADHELLTPLKDSKERYPELIKINQGGMKRIMSGNDAITGRKVAIARMLSYDTADDLELFLREARITACLEHPNIMPVYDISTDEEGLPFFTMKLLEGEDLQAILDELKKDNPVYQEKYRLNYLLEIFLKICDAMAYAHNRGILHLDLKPQNIKTSDFGEVILCDWGLARLLDDADPELVMKDGVAGPLADITRSMNTTIKGTPGYMSPEQASHDPKSKTDTTTDIYSLGALLYSFLTFEVPFEGKDNKEVLSKTLSGEIVPPSKRKPQLKIPHSLEAVTLKAMALEPQNRYASVQELQTDVRNFVEGYATDAENAPFHKLLLLMFKRHAALAVISILLLLVIPIGSYLFTESLEANRKRLETVSQQKIQNEIQQEKLSLNTASILIKNCEELIHKGEYGDALETINKSLDLNPSSTKALEIKATLLTGALRFKEAKETALKSSEYTNQYFISLHDNYVNDISQSGLLNLESFLHLLSDLQNDLMLEEQGDFEKFKNRISKLLFKQLTLDTFSKYDLKSRLTTLEEMLAISNPQSDEIKLNIKHDKDRLELKIENDSEIKNLDTLSRLPITHLSLKKTGVKNLSPLRNCALLSLDLTSTKVHDLSPLKNQPLQTLNLSKTPVSDLSSIMQTPIRTLYLGSTQIAPLSQVNIFPYLEKLHIPKSLYDKSVIDTLESRIRVFFIY